MCVLKCLNPCLPVQSTAQLPKISEFYLPIVFYFAPVFGTSTQRSYRKYLHRTLLCGLLSVTQEKQHRVKTLNIDYEGIITNEYCIGIEVFSLARSSDDLLWPSSLKVVCYASAHYYRGQRKVYLHVASPSA